MATSDVTVSFDLLNLLGVPFRARGTKVWVTFNTDTGWIVDDEGAIRMDAGTATVSDAGLVTITGIPIPSADTNPIDFQVKIHFDAPVVLPGVRGITKNVGDFGWMTITADADLSDLIAEQYVPPTWMTEAVATLQGYLDQGADLLAAQIEISGINTSDLAVAGLISNILLGPLTNAAVSDSIARQAITKAAAAVGNKTTDAASLAAALAAGSSAITGAGTYILDKLGVTVPANKRLDVRKGSVLKVGDSELNGATGTNRVVRLNSGSTFVGEIDGNRANQDKAAYNAAGGAGAQINLHGIFAPGTSGSPLTNIYVDATVRGVVDQPLHFEYVNDSYIRIRAIDCGGPIYLYECHNVTVEIISESADNNGWKTFPHAIDIIDSSSIRGSVTVRGQFGTGTLAGGTALSDYISGLTVINSTDIVLDRVDVEASSVSGQALGVGVSLVGVARLESALTRIHRYNDVLLELGGVVDSTISGLDLDGWHSVSGIGASSGRGIAAYNNAIPGTLHGRTWEHTRNVKFMGGNVRGCVGHALDLWAAKDTTWHGVNFTDSLVGMYSKLTYDATVTPQGVGRASGAQIIGHKFFGCACDYNENSGAELWDAVDFAFFGCRANNNAQARSFGSTRSGVAVDANGGGFVCKTSSNKTGLRFVEPEADDTQTFTAPGFLNPTDGSKILVDRAERYGSGQVVTIAGAGASGVNLVTRLKMDKDGATLTPPAVTFPTVAGTGTIQTTGTAVVGVGTAFLTQIVGRAYIKVGSDYRQIWKTPDNTHATIESAFPSDLAPGTSFSIVQATITGMPSQTYGAVFTADTISPSITTRRPFAGNVTGDINDGTAAATKLHTTLTDLAAKMALTVRSAYKSGWYISPGGNQTAAIPAEAELHYTPLIIPKDCTLDRLVASVTVVGTSGAVIRLGLYLPDADGLPGALLLDAGTVSGTAVARPAATISQAVSAGLVYAAAVVQGAAGTRPTMTLVGFGVAQQSVSTDSAVAFSYGGYMQSGVTGALPANATPSTSASNPIRVAARFA